MSIHISEPQEKQLDKPKERLIVSPNFRQRIQQTARIRKAIAIDFDGCLFSDAYPGIGEPNWNVIHKAKEEQAAGAGLILWTCREGRLLQEALDACESCGLEFDAVNESLAEWIEEYGTRPRKVGASEYWDDRAVQMGGEKNHEYEHHGT